jgi:hypothetical protein
MPRPISFALSLLGAALATQAPEFAQQYRQRLGGAIDELRGMVAQFDAEASRQGLDRAGGVRRLQENTDPLAQQRGLAMRSAADRLERLEAQRQRMESAGPVGRVAALAADPDPQVARNAYQAFEPAIPTTGEGVILGFLGFLASFGVIELLLWPFRSIARRPAKTSRS